MLLYFYELHFECFRFGRKVFIALVIGRIRIIDIMFGPTPVASYHFVQQPTLCGICKYMLSQTTAQLSGLFEQFLLTARVCSDPCAPVQAFETL